VDGACVAVNLPDGTGCGGIQTTGSCTHRVCRSGICVEEANPGANGVICGESNDQCHVLACNNGQCRPSNAASQGDNCDGPIACRRYSCGIDQGTLRCLPVFGSSGPQIRCNDTGFPRCDAVSCNEATGQCVYDGPPSGQDYCDDNAPCCPSQVCLSPLPGTGGLIPVTYCFDHDDIPPWYWDGWGLS
jgi:hypothetical protein